MFSLFLLKMKKQELVELIVFSEFLRVREQLFQNLFVGQVQAKSWALKAFIAEFPTILLDEFPVVFECPVLVRFSLKLLHNLNTNTTHSPAQVLDNMKAIEDDFSAWKKLSSQVIVGTKHVHCNDFNAVSDLSGIAKEMVANRCLSPSV